MCTSCAVPAEVRKGHRTPGTGLKDDGKPVCQCWKLTLDPLEDQQGSQVSEATLQPLCCFLFVFCSGKD